MKLSVEIIFIFILGIIILYQYCSETEHFADVAGTTIAAADIDSIRNLNSIAKSLMKPDGTITNPGNLNVAGNINIGNSTKGLKIEQGTGDGATYDTYNGALSSWNGLALRSTCSDSNCGPLGGKPSHVFNTRNGDTFLKGNVTMDKGLTINGDCNNNPNLILKNTVPSWCTGDKFTDYRFIKTESVTIPADGPFKQFNVGPGGVSIGQANTPGYGSPDALYVTGNTNINGNLTASNFSAKPIPDNLNLGNTSMTNTKMNIITFAGGLSVQYGEAATSHNNWTVVKFSPPFKILISWAAYDRDSGGLITRYAATPDKNGMQFDNQQGGATKYPATWFALGII